MSRLNNAMVAGMMIGALLMAATWRSVIDMLLFTSQLWAPVIFVTVCMGVLSKRHGEARTRNVLISMLVAMGAAIERAVAAGTRPGYGDGAILMP